jgi:hypothetical protein
VTVRLGDRVIPARLALGSGAGDPVLQVGPICLTADDALRLGLTLESGTWQETASLVAARFRFVTG